MSLNIDPPPPIDSIDVVIPPPIPHHPWRRFLARHLDLGLWAILFGLILLLLGIEQHGGRGEDLFFAIGAVVSWIPLESAFLVWKGATPGKKIFGLDVRSRSGALLGWKEALKRSFWVAVAGMGLGLPMLSLLANWRSWNELGSHGTTSWDGPEGYVVNYGGFRWWVALLFGGGLGLVLVLLMAIGSTPEGN